MVLRGPAVNCMPRNPSACLPTILKSVLSQSEVVLLSNLKTIGEKDTECSGDWFVTMGPGGTPSSLIGSTAFYCGVSWGKIRQTPSLELVKPRKDMNNVICRRNVTEIILKAK